MKTIIYIRFILALSITYFFVSCEDFVEVDSPTHRISGQTVFKNEESAKSAIQGIYNQLLTADFSGGWQNSVSALAGLSADNMAALRETNLTYLEFDENEILPDNTRNYALWSSAYNIIYMANSLLEGVAGSDLLSEELRNRLEGEAKFIRAFTYFYLTNLYNEVPLILTTDYSQNAIASQQPQKEIYYQIIEDLEESILLLPSSYENSERTNVNRFTAVALLARVHLYQENWLEAETLSTEVIGQTEQYEILDSLDLVFLPNSREAIWQISPIGRGNSLTHTNEGSIFIIHPTSPGSSNFKLSNDLISTYQPEDLRFSSWINYHEELDVYYPFKYKDRYSNNNITEYSMVLRLAEQYLIRSEARAMQNDLDGAISDLNKLRSRADLEPISSDESIDKNTLLELIQRERRKEMFSEWGHRWLDLKRTEKVSEFLGSNSMWEQTDEFYPIPEQERIKNTNLIQNPGY